MPERHAKTSASKNTPNPPNPRRSEAAENYLLSLRILQEDGIAPHISEIAEYLKNLPEGERIGTTLASVSGMIGRLSREGLLFVDSQKQIYLTEEGARLAHGVVRRHRLAERMLVDILGIPLEQAETEAHRLEHSISEELLRQIEVKLDYPDTCPYGRSIDRAGEIGPKPESADIIPLSETVNHYSYKIIRIPDEAQSLLEFLVANKILPGAVITITDNAPYRGVVDLKQADEKVSVGLRVASRIKVRPN